MYDGNNQDEKNLMLPEQGVLLCIIELCANKTINEVRLRCQSNHSLQADKHMERN